MYGRGNPVTVLIGLFALLIYGAGVVLFYAVVTAFVIAALIARGIFTGIKALCRKLSKNRKVKVSQAPRPVMSPVTKPGPRDWTPREQ